MKKYLRVIFLIVFTFTLCSCSDKKEYNLIELTASELTETLFSEENNNIIFAFYNSSLKDAKQFLEDLKRTSSTAKLDIYYIDSNHIDTSSFFILSSLDILSIDYNTYYARINGEFIVSDLYKDYKTMYDTLKEIGYKSNIKKESKEEKLKKIEEAKTLYDEGKISKSINVLNLAWDLEEAKETFNTRKYYNILKSWERYEYINSKTEEVYYENISFDYDSNTYSHALIKSKYNKDFKKPSYPDDYDTLYYYIKDDIIYTSDKESGKYKETYKITYLDSENLDMINLKTKKEYQYILRW